MTKLFSGSDTLSELNHRALLSDKLEVHNVDAFLWLRDATEQYDFVVIDFPDPTNYSLGKLYTTAFFTQLHHVLAPGGAFVVQSTSPILARKSFWCVDRTIREVGFRTLPYHAFQPEGYSCNILFGGGYVTLHSTPDEYLSLECLASPKQCQEVRKALDCGPTQHAYEIWRSRLLAMSMAVLQPSPGRARSATSLLRVSENGK